LENVVIRFLKQSLLSYKALNGHLNKKMILFDKVVNPIMQLLFFTMLAKFVYQTDDVTPWVIGNAFLLSVYNSIFGVGGVMVNERSFGTLKLVIASTANKFLVFTGRAFMHVLDGLVTVIIGLVAGVLLFHCDFSETNFWLFALCLFVSMFAAMGMGLLIGSIGLVASDINLILNLSMFIIFIFTGAEFPLSKLPGFLHEAAYLLPITRGIEASRLIVNGQINAHVFHLIGMEFVVGVVYVLIGYFVLKYMENLAKKHAALDAY